MMLRRGMPTLSRRLVVVGGLVLSLPPSAPRAQPNAKLEQSAREALNQLYASTPKARQIGERSQGILVFPRIVKAGFLIGGQSGEGVLFQRGRAVGYYNISAGSYGLQAGGQTFKYALFFVTPKSLESLDKNNGWAVGSGPSYVVLDSGKAKTMNTTTLKDDVYAMPFGQKGLMAGMGLEGSKITRTGSPQ